MQTAAISYRVADFLKQHPPFHTMDEVDLLALVEHGRVRFHESDEYIYWQDNPHSPFVFVIQQGTVALWEADRLRDIRGAGDMLGIDRFLGAEKSLYAAKTCSDVVLYALKVEDFGSLVVKYPHAGRYVASHAAVAADYQQPDRRRGAHQTFVSEVVDLRPALACPPGQSIREALRAMQALGVDAAVSAEENGRVTGVITNADALRWIAAGGDVSSPVDAILRAPSILPPDTLVSDCVLVMAEPGVEAVAVANSLVTASDLAPAFQDHPVAILRAIPSAPDIAALRRLHLRARAFLLEELSTASAVDWLARYSHSLNAAIVRRIIQLTGAGDADDCWCFYGAAGRGESMTPVAPAVAVIGRGSGSVRTALAECGYLQPENPDCASLDEWRARFRDWVRDPVRSQMYRAHPLFDLRPVAGPPEPWRQLSEEVARTVQAESAFLHLLAHDCLANLPPLTFFRDLVVEESGEQTGVFHLKRSALQPLVDVGRVFAIAGGAVFGRSTLERFALARKLLPDREAIFREAAEALRVVLYHQARAGIRQGSSGSELPPALLSRYDRQVLKSCFRSIYRLLEFTAECQWLEETQSAALI